MLQYARQLLDLSTAHWLLIAFVVILSTDSGGSAHLAGVATAMFIITRTGVGLWRYGRTRLNRPQHA